MFGTVALTVAGGFAEVAEATETKGASSVVRGEHLPRLGLVLEIVSTNAPDVQRGAAFVKASRATMVGAKRPPVGNPDFQIFAETGNVDGSKATKDVFIDGQVVVPWEIWRQRRKRMNESEAYTNLAEASLDTSRAGALSSAVDAYGLVAVSHTRVNVLEDTIEIASAEAEIYKARAEVGDATIRDAKVALLEVARNQVLLAEAQADLRMGLAMLARLANRRFQTHQAISPEPPWRIPPPPSKSTELPAVRQAKAEADYHRKTSIRSRAEGKIPLGVLFRLGRGDLGEMRLGGGVTFSLPLFQKNQGAIAQAEASAEQAATVASIEKQAQEIALEGTLLELEQLENALRVIDHDALPAARAAVAAAEEIQRAGKSDILPVLISRRDYAALRLRRLDILGRMWIALGRIVLIRGVEP